MLTLCTSMRINHRILIQGKSINDCVCSFQKTPSTGVVGWLSLQVRINWLLPFMRSTDSRPRRWGTTSPSSWSTNLSSTWPSLLIWPAAASCHPPRPSTESGWKTIPSAAHRFPYLRHFSWYLWSRAYPASSAALLISWTWREETTETSMARGHPPA